MNLLLPSSLLFAKIINVLLNPNKYLTGYVDYYVSKKGVTISSLNHTYYKDRFMGGRRIKPEATF
jgi:hypothetical protein